MVRKAVQCGGLEKQSAKLQVSNNDKVLDGEATIRAVPDVFGEPFWVVFHGSRVIAGVWSGLAGKDGK